VSATGSYFSHIFGNPRCFAARYSLTNLRANLSPSRPLARPPPVVVVVVRLRRRFFSVVRPIVRQTRIDRLDGAPPFSNSDRNFPEPIEYPRRRFVSIGKYRNASPRAECDGARAYFAPLTRSPIGKPDVACQVGTPASAMLIATPEVRIQADPRPKPLVPRPSPLSLTPIHIRRRPMSTTRTDPLSRFHRPRLLSSLTSPYRALLHAPAFSLRNTDTRLFHF
jgi:hypothetical protein